MARIASHPSASVTWRTHRLERAVAEPDDPLVLDGDAPAHHLQAPHEVRAPVTQRHGLVHHGSADGVTYVVSRTNESST